MSEKCARVEAAESISDLEDARGRILRALTTLVMLGDNKDARNLHWVIDQTLRELAGPNYPIIVKQMCEARVCEWDTGTAP